MERANAWKKYPQGEKREEVFQFAEGYRRFLSDCKTERECAKAFYDRAREKGFMDLEGLIAAKQQVKPGDRIVVSNMGKGLALFVMGQKPLEEGMNILGAHIDSPRMDLKQVPLYEDTELAMLDTLVEQCRAQGITALHGVYLPTAKNKMVAGLYDSFGFTKQSETPEGRTDWTLDISTYTKRNHVIRINQEGETEHG